MNKLDSFSSLENYFTPTSTPSSYRKISPSMIQIPKKTFAMMPFAKKIIHPSKSQAFLENQKKEATLIEKKVRRNSLEGAKISHYARKKITSDFFEPFSAGFPPPFSIGIDSSLQSPLGEFALQKTQTLPVIFEDRKKYVKNALKNAAIFVVDDDFFSRNVMCEKFISINSKTKIYEAESGGIFLDKFEMMFKDIILSNFILIIMDYSMPPGINGLETIESVRKIYFRESKKIIILAHTAEEGETADFMISAGANAALAKGGGKYSEFIDLLYELIRSI